MSEQALIQFRADRELKDEVTDILEAVGLDMSTALRMFLIKARQVRGLPFEVVLPPNHLTRNEALNVLAMARQELSDLPEMSIDEIDAEIHASRRERRIKTS